MTVTFLAMSSTLAAGPTEVGAALSPRGDFFHDLLRQLIDPLFWLGMAAQGLFFARFIIQWLVSEKRKRSTVPTVFWYISLAGGALWFVYGVLRRDLVIMSGGVVSSGIYIRNLMLIHGRARRLRRAGLAPTRLQAEADEEDGEEGLA